MAELGFELTSDSFQNQVFLSFFFPLPMWRKTQKKVGLDRPLLQMLVMGSELVSVSETQLVPSGRYHNQTWYLLGDLEQFI